MIIDPDDEARLRKPEAAVRFKYLIADCPARRRYARLLTQAVVRLSKLASHHRRPNAGWAEYQTLMDTELSDMDEALFDFAHFLADLMAVDGALLVTQALDLVGFGAELRFEATSLKSVRHALDLEGEIWANEPLEMSGPGIGRSIGFAGVIQGAWPSLFHKTGPFNLCEITTAP